MFYDSKKILDYSTRSGTFKRLEPHFQISATRSGWKILETECTKEPISAIPNNGLTEKFAATTETRNIL